jgi:hypothetical protein
MASGMGNRQSPVPGYGGGGFNIGMGMPSSSAGIFDERRRETAAPVESSRSSGPATGSGEGPTSEYKYGSSDNFNVNVVLPGGSGTYSEMPTPTYGNSGEMSINYNPSEYEAQGVSNIA